MRRSQISLLIASLPLLLMAACSNSTTQSSATLVCTASATQVSGTNEINLTVTASGGTANYTLTSVMASSATGTLASGSQTFALTATDTIQFGSLASTSLPGTIGSVNISDSANLTATCPFTLATTTASTTPICTMTPSISSPGINQVDTFTLSVTSGGTAPYTFTNFNPGSYGAVSSTLTATSTTQATAAAVYSSAITATPAATVTDSLGNVGTCNTSVYVNSSTSTTNGNLSCSLSHSINGNTVTLSGAASDGESLTFYEGDPGAGGTVVFTGNPSTITYSFTGQKTVTVILRTASGTLCNGGSPIYDTFYIGTTGSSTSAPACTAVLSPSYAAAGSSVNLSAQITNQGAGNVVLSSLNYLTSSGMTGSFTSSLSGVFTFPLAGTWPITLTVRDASGTTATCVANETIY